jgi:hypothetical protein
MPSRDGNPLASLIFFGLIDLQPESHSKSVQLLGHLPMRHAGEPDENRRARHSA